MIKAADPEIVEEWKWGIPVWSHSGIVCTGETYKNAVKTTFAKGAFLDDPFGLFNSSLEGNLRRAIDFNEGEKINARALKALVHAAVELNTSDKKVIAKREPAKKAAAKQAPAKKAAAEKTPPNNATAKKAPAKKAPAKKARAKKATKPNTRRA